MYPEGVTGNKRSESNNEREAMIPNKGKLFVKADYE